MIISTFTQFHCFRSPYLEMKLFGYLIESGFYPIQSDGKLPFDWKLLIRPSMLKIIVLSSCWFRYCRPSIFYCFMMKLSSPYSFLWQDYPPKKFWFSFTKFFRDELFGWNGISIILSNQYQTICFSMLSKTLPVTMFIKA